MSLSREFATFVANLEFGNLPPQVVDRAKGVTLQALTSALVARDMPASRQALALMQEEEAGGRGSATVLCHGTKLTKAGAAFVNAEGDTVNDRRIEVVRDNRDKGSTDTEGRVDQGLRDTSRQRSSISAAAGSSHRGK